MRKLVNRALTGVVLITLAISSLQSVAQERTTVQIEAKKDSTHIEEGEELDFTVARKGEMGDEDSGSSTMIIGGVAVVLVAAGVFFALKKKK